MPPPPPPPQPSPFLLTLALLRAQEAAAGREEQLSASLADSEERLAAAQAARTADAAAHKEAIKLRDEQAQRAATIKRQMQVSCLCPAIR